MEWDGRGTNSHGMEWDRTGRGPKDMPGYIKQFLLYYFIQQEDSILFSCVRATVNFPVFVMYVYNKTKGSDFI